MVLLLNAPPLVIIEEYPRRDAHIHAHTLNIRHIQPRYGHTLSSASSSRYLTNKLLSKYPLLPRRSRHKFRLSRVVDRPLFDAAVDRGQLGEHRGDPDVCARNDKRYVAFRDEGKSVTGDIDLPSHLQRKSWMEKFVGDVRARLDQRRFSSTYANGNFIYFCTITFLSSFQCFLKEILWNWRYMMK